MGLEDLAPMAMLKIEALALEGLKVQAEMAEQDAPYAVEPLADDSNRRMPALLKSGRPRRNQQGDFMTMDEWMRRHENDENDDDDEEQHGTVATWNRQKHSRGFMDDTVTLAMLVHLRDPLCNNEPVGAPMMALVQAERVKTHKLPGRRASSSSARRSFSAEPESKSVQDEDSPQFKIVDITIAGLRTSTETTTSSSSSSTTSTPIWGTQKQLAAGSRWLAAHGMAKSSSSRPSNSGFKSKPAAAPRSALWSLSDRVYGSGARWRGAAHPHIQNPDVLFADTGIRTF